MKKISYLPPELVLSEIEDPMLLCGSPAGGGIEDLGYEDWSETLSI